MARFLGVIGCIYEATATCVEWQIADFFSIVGDDEDYRFRSPVFSLAGCSWGLILCPENGKGALRKLFPSQRPETKTAFKVGIKRADGALEEVDSGTLNFDSQYFRTFGFNSLRHLQRRRSELVPSGTLTITCCVVAPAPEQDAPTPSPKVDTQQMKQLVGFEKLSSDFKNLLDSQSNCDVTVNVQGKVFQAHRAVLSARSSVFGAMYKHDTEESRTGVLKITDCDPDTFSDFLRYLYTGRAEQISFQSAYHLYATSEKYDVQELKSFCSDHIKQNLSAENVCDVVTLADRYFDDGLMSAAQEFFNGNFRAIFLTSEWQDMVRNNPRLVNELLSGMASATSNSS